MSVRIGVVAVAATLLLFATLQWRAGTSAVDVGFWYEDFPFTFDQHSTSRLGGPLTEAEITSIKRLSLREIERAFSGLAVTLSGNRHAFWSVRVMPALERRMRQQLPNAGETLTLGLLGARSAVSFNELAGAAFAHAPADASREVMIEGIGRGIGRAAVHELAHAIVGVNPAMDIQTDANSYEYFSFNRPSQYYGELHWAGAGPLIEENVGKNREAGAQ